YDSRAGTFLTEDSYQGELGDPLSQNRYAYVHNNPVNYTDPSGHIWNKLWNGAKKLGNDVWNGTKKLYHKGKRTLGNAWNATKKLVNDGWNKTAKFVGNVYTSTVTAVGSGLGWLGNQVLGGLGQLVQRVGSAYNWVLEAGQQGFQEITNRWHQARISGLSTHNWERSKTKEAQNINRNWTKALEETIRHFCEIAPKANGGTVYASEVTFTPGQTSAAQDFKNNLEKQYGF
ncbi:hypothetical protein IR123_10790, partial [Streptococcus sp. 19428wC2_LYSM12]